MKKLWFRPISLVISATGFAFAPMAHAYDYYNSPAFIHNTVTMPSHLAFQSSKNAAQNRLDELNAEDKRNAKNKSSGTYSQASQSANPASPTSNCKANATDNPLPYVRNKAVTDKKREEFLTELTRQMPQEAPGLRKTAEQTDLVQVIAGFVRLACLDSGTMEGVMAYWYGQAWAIANQKPLPTPQQYQGIAAQLKISNAKSPQWSKLTDQQRQEFFEGLAYPLFIQKANYQAYLKQGKTDSMQRMASATQAGFKKMGVELASFDLTNSGLNSR